MKNNSKTYNFGLIADTNTRFRERMTLKELGQKIVKMKMREDNDKTVLSYLSGWANCLEDLSDEGEKFDPLYIADYVADHLTSSNIHIINLDTNCQISSGERDEVQTSIIYLLENAKSVKAAKLEA